MPQPHHSGSGLEQTLQVNGMTCTNCARHVQEALQKTPGVDSARVDLAAGRATVRLHPGAAVSPERLVESVQQAGYQAAPAGSARPGRRGGWLQGWRFNVLFGGAATLFLALGEMGMGWGNEAWFRAASLAIGTLVQALCGARFYAGAWTQLKRGRTNMDTLVALGSTAAYGYSAWGYFSGQIDHLYFMDAAAIISLISLGHWLEGRATARAESSLKNLLHLAPEQAIRRGPGGDEPVPVSELQVQDRVVLRPGDRVPTDGVVEEGASTLDESMLTGESMPVNKAPGGELFAGTLNINGRLVMRVTRTGMETALAHVIAAVERAQNSRAGIQRVADAISSVFVPIVILLAIATALWWGLAYDHARYWSGQAGEWIWPGHLPTTPLSAAILHATAVLIIACPCAMGLATPVAIMAGANVASRRGILIRDGVALEKAGLLTTVVFDKTGTLTEGRPSVSGLLRRGPAGWLEAPAGGEGSPAAAGAMAASSSHPLSQAIAEAIAARPRLEQWEEIRGAGIRGLQQGQTLRLGSLKWLQEEGVEMDLPAEFENRWSSQGATLVGYSEGARLEAVFALLDRLKPGAAAVVDSLQRSGYRVFLLTGDRRPTALAIGQQLGLSPSQVFAEVRPEHKAQTIRELQQQGERVACVGDGINDAPALEQADLGIAVSKATDIARKSADILLLKSEIGGVVESLELARATLKVIRQNFFWAFFYNAAAVPVAMIGLLSPILCAAAMGISDLVVIGNALRLNWTRRWRTRQDPLAAEGGKPSSVQ